MEHVGARTGERAHHLEMLQRLQRQAQARPFEEARRERIEALASPVAVRVGQVTEAEAGRRELDLGARARQRGGELVVVPGRERRRIGKQDAHGSSVVAC